MRIVTPASPHHTLTAEELLNRWLEHLAADRSPATARRYEAAIRRFLAWYEAEERQPLRIEALTPVALVGFRNQLQKTQARSSVNIHVSALRTWCGWLTDTSYLDADPAARLKLVGRQDPPAPQALKGTEVNALLRAAARSRHPQRDTAIMHMLLQTGMRIGSVTHPITVLYDTIRLEEKALVESSDKTGIKIEMVDCKNLVLDIDKKSTFSTVLQRCVSYYRNLHSTAALEGMGANVINSLHCGIYAGNKLFTHMLLQKAKIPTPYVTVTFSKDSALQALDGLGYPRVIKPTVGSWGRMVTKLNDKEAAEGIIEEREKMYPIYQVHYLEEFVKRPPRDIRAIVIGDSVAGAIYRNSTEQNWKTNTHLGGTAEICKVTKELEDMCIRAKDAVKGQIVGVDLMESKDKGLLVHEINNTTEYRNVARVTGVDIAAKILEYAINSGK